MNLITEESMRRNTAFERIVNAGEALLQYAEVQADPDIVAYGKVGVFLPDIVHGIVRLPRDKRDTNDIPVIPLLESDRENGGLRLSAGMLAPTPQRMEKIHAATAVSGIGIDETRARYAHQGLAFAREHDNDITEMSALRKEQVAVLAEEVPAAKPTLMVARPHMVFRPNMAATDEVAMGAALLHGIGHTQDIEALDEFPSDLGLWWAGTELKQTGLTTFILEAAGVATDDNFVRRNGFQRMIATTRAWREAGADGSADALDPRLYAKIMQPQLDTQPFLATS